ncbi:MAG: hypothetical protein ABI837_06000 [Acidobacteriota bacterium]
MVHRESSLRIGIASPNEGDILHGPDIGIHGTLVTTTKDVGVVVNKFVATVDLNHAGNADDPLLWSVHLKPPPGPVRISAIATTGAGEQASTALGISLLASQRAVLILPSPTEGVAPLEVGFRVEAPLRSTIEIDYDGTGLRPVAASEPHVFRYETPGLKTVVVRITDVDGLASLSLSSVQVHSISDIDEIIQHRWAAFLEALGRGDLARAGVAFADDRTRARYLPILERIRPNLARLATDLHSIQAIAIRGASAVYLATRVEGGINKGYYIYFAKDTDGVWKVAEF